MDQVLNHRLHQLSWQGSQGQKADAGIFPPADLYDGPEVKAAYCHPRRVRSHFPDSAVPIPF
jgi:hypothetical protein